MAISLGVLASSILKGSYQSIATQTVVAGGVASVSFASIPQNYKHLQIRASIRSNNVAAYDTFYIYNFDGTAVSAQATAHYVYGSGSAAGAGMSTRTTCSTRSATARES